MRRNAPEPLRIAASFAAALKEAGVDLAELLRQAGLPPAFFAEDPALSTVEEFRRICAALEKLCPDPAFALRLHQQYPPEKFHPASIVSQHARDFRDALQRFARYKLLSCGEEMRLEEKEGEGRFSFDYPGFSGAHPPLLVDIVFAAILELGRRGTARRLAPLRVELARPKASGGHHEAHFGCPVRWSARRDLLVFRRGDLDLPFATYNAELLALLSPSLEEEVARRRKSRTLSEKVKWVVSRSLEKGTLDIADIAREIGLGSRTLQRRIAEEGTTFRRLVDETRRELARRYLEQSSLALGETALLLGYEDPNSFFRAFQRWEGRTPGAWRDARKK
ncbi:MAG: AraC family transcriptional regulator [Verrucomicrobium sp.]|nr:AraC family transcriptional regulator [Verrucomicrobium sp.]